MRIARSPSAGISLLALVMALGMTLAGCGAGASEDVDAGAGGSATLSWDPPTTDESGRPLTDLFGYRIGYGPVSGQYRTWIDVRDANASTYAIASLPPGRTYFVVVAYDTSFNMSLPSNEVVKESP